MEKMNSRNVVILILILQFIIFITISFDVPIARQVLGFIYYTFIPGFIFLNLLQRDELDNLNTVIFSLGISIAFLMVAGFLINIFGTIFSISYPLSIMPLTIFLNIIIFMEVLFLYIKNSYIIIYKKNSIRLYSLQIIFLPILSIFGSILVNINENNVILLIMIILIPLIIIIFGFSRNSLHKKLYPFIILMISIALLSHSSLISNYIITFASDVPVEYYVSEITKNNGYWNSTYSPFWDISYSRVNAMLSVTILPTIYSILLNIDISWVFKIIFPLIFSFVPVILYQIWKMYMDEKYAFLSAFLFMSQSTYYTEMIGLNRQMIGEFFLVLLLLNILNKNLRTINIKILYIIISFALIISHYALAELFLLFVSIIYILLFYLKNPSRNISLTMVISFFVIMFTWYIYTSNSTVLSSIIESAKHIYNQLGDFLDPASRGETVLRGLGLATAPSIYNLISRVFAYLTQALIVIGFFSLVTKRTGVNPRKEYFILTVTAMIFLILLIIVPGLADTLNMTRFYHILLLFLSPLCVIGAEYSVKKLIKREDKFLITLVLLIVLIPYFLFQTNFVYEVVGSDSWSVSLSKHRMEASYIYGIKGHIDEHSALGARWLSTYVDETQQHVFSDSPSRAYVLPIYGMMYRGDVFVINNMTRLQDNDVVYLSRLNTFSEIIASGRLWTYSEFNTLFSSLSKVYASGANEVFKNTF